MRISVMGAGAVGGYFGARLAAAGQDVTFIARGKHLEAMKKDGLTVKSIQGDLHIRAHFASLPEETGAVDLILFTVKSQDTETAGKGLAPMMGEKTLVLSLQNGIDNSEKIAVLWGNERTLAGTPYIGARIPIPGSIEHSAAGRIALGRLDGKIDDGTENISRVLTDAKIPCTISAEIRKILWSKLVWNAPFCALAAIAQTTVSGILQSDPLKTLALGCMEEVIEAASSQEIALGPSIVDETLNLSRNLGDFKPSMLQDLEAGKPLEYEALNGFVLTTLRQAGKKAPINENLYALLQHLDQKRRAHKSPMK
ncbi:MAG: ketopantoate reductase family protein [Candidatus Binatia bacterium]|jgi:2-dehydropantoate 2-reductase|nr:ketopantoate reductase family protein [Candidatus Binatia bacterium]